ELDTHRLNAVGVHALDGEVQRLDDLPLLHIHHADSAADLRGGPENLAVLGELDMAWALIDQGVVHQLVGGGVDPVQHVGGFAGVHRPLAVGADGHAFRLDADFDLRQNCTVFHVHNGNQGIVLVGDIQPPVVRVQGKLLGVSARGQLLDDLAAGQVHYLHRVRVAGADVEQLVVMGKGKAAWAHADFQSLDRFQRVQVDNADGVVFLVGDVGGIGQGCSAGAGESAADCRSKECSGHRRILSCRYHHRQVVAAAKLGLEG